ncbi:hypothetical protein ACFL38_03070 [Candidatus Omnitrophota bacterium]
MKDTNTNPSHISKEIYQVIRKIVLLYPNLTVPDQIIKDIAQQIGEYYEEEHQ